jgi:hypothetical protein
MTLMLRGQLAFRVAAPKKALQAARNCCGKIQKQRPYK